MKMLGVKFLLRNTPCGFISAILPETDARELFHRFLNGLFGPNDTVGSFGLEGGWGVKLSDVTALHTYDPRQAEQGYQGAQGQMQMPFPINQSGL